MILLNLLAVYTKPNYEKILDDFLNKDVKIFNSAYAYKYLGEDTKNNSITVIQSRFYNHEKLSVNDVARIIRNKNGYYIKLGDSFMCVGKGRKIIKCEDEKYDLFTIAPTIYGFLIRKDEECVTQVGFDEVRMETCVDGDGQVYDFKLHTTKNKCEEMAKELEEKSELNDGKPGAEDGANNPMMQGGQPGFQYRQSPLDSSVISNLMDNNPLMVHFYRALTDPSYAKMINDELIKNINNKNALSTSPQTNANAEPAKKNPNSRPNVEDHDYDIFPNEKIRGNGLASPVSIKINLQAAEQRNDSDKDKKEDPLASALIAIQPDSKNTGSSDRAPAALKINLDDSGRKSSAKPETAFVPDSKNVINSKTIKENPTSKEVFDTIKNNKKDDGNDQYSSSKPRIIDPQKILIKGDDALEDVLLNKTAQIIDKVDSRIDDIRSQYGSRSR